MKSSIESSGAMWVTMALRRLRGNRAPRQGALRKSAEAALVVFELVELVLDPQFLSFQIGDSVVVRQRASVLLGDLVLERGVLLLQRDDPIGFRHAVFSSP
jgi:hypothetical protein